MNNQAWNDLLCEKVEAAGKEAQEASNAGTDKKLPFSSYWVRFFAKTLAATGRVIRDELRHRNSEIEARLTAIEEHLTANRESDMR